jgi:hypothetical protein
MEDILKIIRVFFAFMSMIIGTCIAICIVYQKWFNGLNPDTWSLFVLFMCYSCITQIKNYKDL